MRLGIDKDKAAQESPKLKVRFSKKVTLLVKKLLKGPTKEISVSSFKRALDLPGMQYLFILYISKKCQ